jgi:2-C-methyl-D-erythritol 4-phosphate cytidylyltransferase
MPSVTIQRYKKHGILTMSSLTATRLSYPSFWAVVPAAGAGTRMAADRPKQYLVLNGKPVLIHTLQRLAAIEGVQGIMLSLSPQDRYWPEVKPELSVPLWTTAGGVERSDSVLNALQDLGQYAKDEDWVLVHDAARPCVRREDIVHLISQLKDDAVGGLLARPVSDTMKRAEPNRRIVRTEAREDLWHALTPQMFRLGRLRHAIEQAIEFEASVTDEASAMELAGYQPLLVEGHADNIKITRPEDLPLAAFYLQQQDSP